MDGYEHFWSALSWVEWLMICALLVTLVLVALAAAAWSNPVALERRPVRLPDHKPRPASPTDAELKYEGAHRAGVDRGERTTNLGPAWREALAEREHSE